MAGVWHIYYIVQDERRNKQDWKILHRRECVMIEKKNKVSNSSDHMIDANQDIYFSHRSSYYG
jgi:hypothetical protein